ncbi:MAG: TIGR00282 family metallophosphoesterase [bacterium]
MKILFFGDIVGKVGRLAAIKALTVWKEKYKQDVVIGNVENLAHGKGVTSQTLQELVDGGFQAFTSGNHIWNKEEIHQLFSNKSFPLCRPGNYPIGAPGPGRLIIPVGGKTLVIINIIGQVNMLVDGLENPFRFLDKELEDPAVKQADCVIVDFHAEVTSEKWAFGWHADGKVNAVVGTHTHVPTADSCRLTKGTLYQTDIGMTGGFETVLGVSKDIVLKKFLTGLPAKFDYPDSGLAWANAVLLDLDKDKGKQNITRLQELVEVR